MKRAAWVIVVSGVMAVSGCVAEEPFVEIPEPTGPQVAPDDPCNGVVPQLCPRY